VKNLVYLPKNGAQISDEIQVCFNVFFCQALSAAINNQLIVAVAKKD
jgi:hypothetical protein